MLCTWHSGGEGCGKLFQQRKEHMQRHTGDQCVDYLRDCKKVNMNKRKCVYMEKGKRRQWLGRTLMVHGGRLAGP